MKRFLLLLILIVFVTVSSVGTNKLGWTKPVWIKSHGEFEKDRKACIESIDNNLDSEAFGRALEECMRKKGYQCQIVEVTEKPLSPGMIVLCIAGAIVIIPLVVVLGFFTSEVSRLK